MSVSRDDYENEFIPPTDEKRRGKLERKADTLLEAAGDEKCDDWPGSWTQRPEMEFERIAAAHTGMVPLAVTSLCASLPDFAPETPRHAVESMMRERPGLEAAEPVVQLLDAVDDSAVFGSGFTMERRNFPPETCRWGTCQEPLYASEAARGRGNPRKYCNPHKRAAKSHTQRLRRKGIYVGVHRNMSYRPDGEKPAVAAWLKTPKIGGKSTDQYQQSRDVWETLNVPQAL
ncbi:hypothetical protein [Streptomyces noursei]|uniref:hypothetical protein n=1 Tax=Streptomyces noursei TaxID=1971 RepID=UPI000C9BE831|nr:hypothetical protein [Streptomyces noursei]